MLLSLTNAPLPNQSSSIQLKLLSYYSHLRILCFLVIFEVLAKPLPDPLASTSPPTNLPSIAMSITDMRLKQIAEIEKKIEENITWIQEKKKEVEEKLAVIANVTQDLRSLLSRSASTSTGNRGMSEPVEIDESVTRDEAIIEELEQAIAEREAELQELEKEKEVLEKR